MIWLEYCGYCWAVSLALANDFVSSDSTLLLTLSAFGEAAMEALRELA